MKMLPASLRSVPDCLSLIYANVGHVGFFSFFDNSALHRIVIFTNPLPAKFSAKRRLFYFVRLHFYFFVQFVENYVAGLERKQIFSAYAYSDNFQKCFCVFTKFC